MYLVLVFDNPSKCGLNTLQFTPVETGQTPEERVAVIKATTHHTLAAKIAASSVKYVHDQQRRN